MTHIIYQNPTIPCPCGEEAEWQPKSDMVYQKDYGPIYLCHHCGAYVGVHKVGREPHMQPLGFPAGPGLRALRKRVHALLDPYWKEGKYKRGTVYARLAKAMNLHPDNCHVAMFDEEQCLEAIRLFTTKK